MNINVGDYLLATDTIKVEDKYSDMGRYLKAFTIFVVSGIDENLYEIYTSDDENWFKWYYVSEEELKDRCVKLKVEEV